MALRLAAFVPVVLALLFGLGIPKAFSLLYVVLMAAAWLAWRRPGPKPSLLTCWSASWLFLFGLSYAAFQVGWLVWSPPQRFVPEILAVLVLPSAGMLVGWLLQRFGVRFGSRLILAYALGALIYALLVLVLSRSPWWALTQRFHHVVRVPWGEDWMSTRAVEQRAFLALTMLPMGIPLLLSPQSRQLLLGVISILMGGIAVHVAWALDGRIGWAALVLSGLPLLFLIPNHGQRWLVGGAAASSAALAIASGRLCDERWWLVNGFLRHLSDAPWGGRLMVFDYQECRPGVLARFGSGPHSNAFAHNVVLDVFNDAGLVPALCILLAVLPMVAYLLYQFWSRFCEYGWNWQLSLRWGFLSVLIVQWLAQPFLYSDQLMFTIGFLFAGMLLAEFNSDSPLDWPVAKPSRQDRSP